MSAIVTSLFLSGCYINHAILDPYGAAPLSKDKFWTAPERAKKTTGYTQEIPDDQSPLTLGEIIDIALKNNTQTWQTWAEARTAAASYAQTQSPALPQFDGQFLVNRMRYSVTFNNNIETFLQSQWGPGLNISYLIFDFGQQKATSEAARQALYFADWTHNRMIQTVIDTVTNDYYNYLYQKQLLIAYKADVESALLVLDEANLGFQTGVRDVSDVLQARTQLLHYQTLYVNQEQFVNTSYATLLTDMGIAASTTLKFTDLPEDLPCEMAEENIDQILDYAMEKRADLLAAESNYRAADQTVVATVRALFPKLNYNFDFGRTYFSGGVNDDYYFNSLFNLSFPIFHGFNLQNAIRKARAQREQAEAQLRQAQLQVIEDVTTAHFDVKVAFEALGFAQKFLDAAEEQFKVAIAQYRQGTNDILNVSNAESAVADARAQKAKAIQQWFTSIANLAYASGSLGYSKQSIEVVP